MTAMPTDTSPAHRSGVGGPLLAAAAALAGLTYVGLVSPDEPGHFPVCPLRALTGWDCPLCGGTRAVHALVHGDLAGALDHNVLVTIAVPVALVLWLRWAWRRWRGADAGLVALGARSAAVLLAVGISFAVIRNLPFAGWLGSG